MKVAPKLLQVPDPEVLGSVHHLLGVDGPCPRTRVPPVMRTFFRRSDHFTVYALTCQPATSGTAPSPAPVACAKPSILSRVFNMVDKVDGFRVHRVVLRGLTGASTLGFQQPEVAPLYQQAKR